MYLWNTIPNISLQLTAVFDTASVRRAIFHPPYPIDPPNARQAHYLFSVHSWPALSIVPEKVMFLEECSCLTSATCQSDTLTQRQFHDVWLAINRWCAHGFRQCLRDCIQLGRDKFHQ